MHTLRYTASYLSMTYPDCTHLLFLTRKLITTHDHKLRIDTKYDFQAFHETNTQKNELLGQTDNWVSWEIGFTYKGLAGGGIFSVYMRLRCARGLLLLRAMLRLLFVCVALDRLTETTLLSSGGCRGYGVGREPGVPVIVWR